VAARVVLTQGLLVLSRSTAAHPDSAQALMLGVAAFATVTFLFSQTHAKRGSAARRKDISHIPM
jgi:hypothetical protein